MQLIFTGHLWLTLAILATWMDEMWRIMDPTQLRQQVSETHISNNSWAVLHISVVPATVGSVK
jgi:hypothetical protein